MTEYYTNFFPIENPEELECEAKLYRIEGLSRVELEKNLNILRARIRQEFHYPAAILWSKDEPKIAVHVDAEGVDKEYQIIPSVARLVDQEDTVTMCFDNLSEDTVPIALEFLDWYVRGNFWRITWQDGRKHFPLDPEYLGNIMRYRGFSLGTKYLPDHNSLCLVLDIIHRYCDATNLGERLKNNEKDLLGMGNTYLYHFGRARYQIHALDVSGYPASDTSFVLNGNKTQDVYSYTVDVCKKSNVPITFKREDQGIIYKYPGRTDTRMGISTLCHRTLKTDEPDVSAIHNQSILEPTKRISLIQEMRNNYLSRLSFNGTPIKLGQNPILVDANYFSVPNHLFGNNAVLSVEGADGVSIVDFPQKRLEFLRNPDAGIYNTRPLEDQFFMAPKSMSRSIRSHFRNTLETGLSELTHQKIELQQILFDASISLNISEVVDSIFSSLDEIGMERGFGVLVLPKGKEMIHNFTKQKGWPKFVFKCVSQRKVERYYFIPRESSEAKVELHERSKGKFRSYVFNTMLGFLMVNQKWPWALNSKLNFDAHIGLDVLNGVAGMSFIYQNARNCFFDARTAGPREKLSKNQTSQFLLRAMRMQLKQLKIEPESIILHRDGLSYQSEIDGFQEVIHELKNENLLPRNVDTGVIEIRKTFALSPRLFKPFEDGTFGNPGVGSYFVFDHNEGIVCNTGWPFRMQGTTKPIHIVIKSGNLDIKDILQDVYSLSNLAWASPRSSMSVPITIKICDEFLRPIASESDE